MQMLNGEANLIVNLLANPKANTLGNMRVNPIANSKRWRREEKELKRSGFATLNVRNKSVFLIESIYLFLFLNSNLKKI